ncbi:MAG: hypothetical protein IT164_07765 [Bryobacterales bacterium]|nr:hypothetical protein [Bryobacterales bacterium]
MARSRAKHEPDVRRVKRTGKPLMIYFSPEQADRLTLLAGERRVTKATIVRYAVDRLLDDLNNGQLELPLGL